MSISLRRAAALSIAVALLAIFTTPSNTAVVEHIPTRSFDSTWRQAVGRGDNRGISGAEGRAILKRLPTNPLFQRTVKSNEVARQAVGRGGNRGAIGRGPGAPGRATLNNLPTNPLFQ